MTLACSVVSPFLPAGDREPGRSSLDSVLVLHEFLHGIRSVVEVSRHWIESGPCKSLFRKPFARGERSDSTEEEKPPVIRQLRCLNDLANWNHLDRHKMYVCAIKQLEHSFVEDQTFAFSWLTSTGADFNIELRRREPTALVILMYWGVLLDTLDEIWWAKYSGRRLVDDLSTILLGYGPQWNEAIAWAKKEVGF